MGDLRRHDDELRPTGPVSSYWVQRVALQKVTSGLRPFQVMGLCMEQHHDRLSVTHLHEALEEAPISIFILHQTLARYIKVKRCLLFMLVAAVTVLRRYGSDMGRV